MKIEKVLATVPVEDLMFHTTPMTYHKDGMDVGVVDSDGFQRYQNNLKLNRDSHLCRGVSVIEGLEWLIWAAKGRRIVLAVVEDYPVADWDSHAWETGTKQQVA